MKRAPSLPAAVLAAAALLPGCAFASRVVPLDPSGMAYPARRAAATVSDQVHRTGAAVTGAPAALGRHCAECWKNLTVDPRR